MMSARYPLKSRVMLAKGYESRGNASYGPLKPGDVGVVEGGDGGGYRVMLGDETWFYNPAALCLDYDVAVC